MQSLQRACCSRRHTYRTADGPWISRFMRASKFGLRLACIVVLVLAAADAQPKITTLQSDVDAMTRIWESLRPYEDSILSNWQKTDSDPCAGGWAGVICSCDDLPSRALAAACQTTSNSTGEHRVLGLDLGPMASLGGQKLGGKIHAAVGQLHELIYLDLSNNELTGTLPDTLSNLSKLQWLLLDNNQLAGLLPGYLGSMPNLKQAQLQGNNLSGPVPTEWCSSQAVFDISNNPYLCGSLPRCQDAGRPRISGAEGTYISTGLAPGGACDSSPPDCDADVGCVIWTPVYWTARGIVNFNFTGFYDYESGIDRYQWGIGSKPSMADVLPLTPLTAGRVLKDIKYAGGTQKMFVTPVVHNLTSVSLLDGQTYYVTVAAWNGAGPPLSINTSSLGVVVDTTGPVAGTVYNTHTSQQTSITASTQSLQASWESFTDPQSGITGYIIQFFQQVPNSNSDTVILKALTDPLAVKNNTNKLQIRTQSILPEGTVYFARVTATNGAGLTTTVQGLPVAVQKAGDGTVSAQYAAMIGILCSVGCLVIGAVMAVYWMKNRVRKHQKREKRRAEDAKQLKALMYALSSQTDLPAGHTGSVSLPQPRRVGELSEQEVAFVFTDIESSTELSQQDGDAFKQVQEVHDQLMREGIAKHGGYEITTEGDSFQVAFTSCHAAMAFCLDIQYRLLEQSWPKQVLALNACKLIKDDHNQATLFAGPRVRMGLHWAREGTVAMRLHNLTRHKVFAGPAIQITMDVSEAAHGGQIVMTEEAVMKLTEEMSQAGFPVIRLLGLFQLPSVPSPVFLFSATEVVGKPLRRQFVGLRKIRQVWPTPGCKIPTVMQYNVNIPPMPNDTNSLVFVCMRLCTYPKHKKCDLPQAVAARFEDVLATSAQQFKGYFFQAHEGAFKEGIWTAAFNNTMDALRFTHAAQMLLMYVNWRDTPQAYFGAEVPSPDGRWLFMGPRVCMAIHESSEFFVSEDPTVDTNGPRRPLCFAGPAVTLPLVLTYAGRGGQVILSELAWDSVKPIVTQHPGAVSIISLGMHVVSDDFPNPMLLMEVMPNLLARRVFSRIMTKRLVEPGFRDAPDPKEPMAIVFVKVAKPEEVSAAEKGASSLDMCDAQISLMIQAYTLGVGKYAALARKLLRRYNGYECKEPEPGKFTLAFKDLADAIRWACHVQEEIMYLDWPEELLKMKGCEVQYDEDDNLIWRGLRLRIGMAYGMVANQKPLNTGRADYFGVLANAAARVMALATPGQVLVEGANPPLGEDGQLLLQQDNPTFLKMHYAPGTHQHHKPQDAVAEAWKAAKSEEPHMNARMLCIHAVGYYLLRGLDNPRLMYSAESFRLQNRPLKIVQDMWAPPLGPYGPLGINSSFASSRDSFRRNWATWVERTRTSWIAKRLSPRNSTSPTGSSEATNGAFNARKGALFRSSSPSAAAGAVGHDPFGSPGAPSAGCVYDGAIGTIRSRSSLSAGSGSMLLNTFGRGLRGAVSEAGRPGMMPGSLGYVSGSVGGTAAGLRAEGGYGGLNFRPGSPRPFHSSHSASAAVGRSLSGADRLAALLPASNGAHVGPIVVDAAGQSEDDSGDTPAAAPFMAAQHGHDMLAGSAAWLLGSSGGGLGTRVSSASALQNAAAAPMDIQQLRASSASQAGLSSRSGVRAPAEVFSPSAAAARSSSSQVQEGSEARPSTLPHHEHLQCGEMKDPLLGCVHIPPIHTSLAPEHVWAESASNPSSSATTTTPSSDTPLAIMPESSTTSQAAAGKTSGGSAKPRTQQPHQQLQEQQRRRSQQMLGRSSGGGEGSVVCPPSVDPNAAPECLQPWQQQLETWHERQHLQLEELDLGAGSGDGGFGMRPDSTPVSLSTTMTSCMDADDAQAQYQQAMATMQKMAMERPDSEASMSFSGAGMKGFLAGVTGNLRPRLSGGSGGGMGSGTLNTLFRPAQNLISKVVRRRSTSSIPTSGGVPHPGDLRLSARGYMSDDAESVDKEVEAVQQQHGMVPHVTSPNSSLSQTPGSSAAGSRAATGGGAEPLVSPGTVWARDVAQSYISARHSSSSTMQVAASSQGGLDGSFGGALAASAPNLQGLQSLGMDGSLGRSSLSRNSLSCYSASRGGSYTYAESSYSPKHCRSSACTNPLAAWPQHSQQQQATDSSSHEQQEEGLLARPSRPQLCPELSLRLPQDSASAEAAAAAVAAVDAEAAASATEVVPLLQDEHCSQSHASSISAEQQQQQQQFDLMAVRVPQQVALDKQAQQDAIAQRLSQKMWESEDGRQQAIAEQQQQQEEGLLLQQHQQQMLLQQDDGLVQLLQQDMLAVEQQQQQFGQAGPSLYGCVIEGLSYNPDIPGQVARLNAGAAGAVHPARATAGYADFGSAGLQLVQADNIALETADSIDVRQHHRKLLTPRSALASEMQRMVMSGRAVTTAQEYRDRMLQLRRVRDIRYREPAVLIPQPAAPADSWSTQQQPPQYGQQQLLEQQQPQLQYEHEHSGPSWSRSSSPPIHEPQMAQQHPVQPLQLQPQPQRPQLPQRGQQLQQAATLLQQQQGLQEARPAAPGVCRPSPLGKNSAAAPTAPKSSASSQKPAAMSTNGAQPAAHASSCGGAVQPAAEVHADSTLEAAAVQQHQRQRSSGGTALQSLQPGCEQQQQALKPAGAPWNPVVAAASTMAGRPGAEDPGASSSSKSFAARGFDTTASKGANSDAALKRAAVKLQAGSIAQAAMPAELPPGNSRPSSGNSSPRFASAAGSLQGGASNTMSLHSLGSSAQNSPRSSLPTTPRSFSQRSALGGSSFAANAAPVSPVAAAAASAAAGGPFQPLHRAGSYSSVGSPRCVAPPAALQGSWGGVSDLDSDAEEDGCEPGGLFLGHVASPNPGRRTPSCSMPLPKDTALVPITELPMMEGRISDPCTDPNAG